MSDLGEPFAEGRTAEVYEWEAGRVVKLFFDSVPAERAAYEAEAARLAHMAGLPVPAGGEMVEVDGRRGILFDELLGPSLLGSLAMRPWSLGSYGRILAETHAQIHSVRAPEGLRSQKEWIREEIEAAEALPEDLKERALQTLDGLPEGDRFCHGDFHPGNVYVTADGAKVIDWPLASRGNALADMARTSIMMSAGGTSAPPPTRWLIDWIRSSFHRAYIKQYFKLLPADREVFVRWRAVAAAAFLNVTTRQDQSDLIELVRKGVALDEGTGS